MAKAKKAVIEDLDDDLELIDDDEDEAPAKPKKNKNKNKAAVEPKAEKADTGMGASWLAEYINEETDKDYTAAQIRVILRRMAADGDLEREVGTDRARYSFTGETDPTVRALLRRIKKGEGEQVKAERIEGARSGEGKKRSKKAADEDVEGEVPKKGKAKRAKVEETEDEAPATKPVRRKRAKSED